MAEVELGIVNGDPRGIPLGTAFVLLCVLRNPLSHCASNARRTAHLEAEPLVPEVETEGQEACRDLGWGGRRP